MICSACGTDNRDGVKFCSRCGAALPDAAAPGYQSVYSQPGQASYPGAVQASPYGGARFVGERREIPMTVILTFVTCGIYGIVWWYKVFTEVASDLGRSDINPMMEIVLTFVTCGVYGMYLCYKYPKLINEMQAKRGLPVNDFSVVSLLCAIFGLNIVSFALMQSELNKIWESGR